MTTLAKVRALWSGPTVVGGGVSTFYTVGTGAALAGDLTTFFGAIKSSFPSGTTWNIDTSGVTIDDNTGDVNGSWGGGTGGAITSVTGSEYAAGVGCRVVWKTGGITGGRIVKGSTYLVPLTANQYDPQGTILTAAVNAFAVAANNLVTAQAGNLVILTKLTPEHSGTSHEVLFADVPDKVSWLRTRRT